MRNKILGKSLVLGLIILIVGASFVSSVSVNKEKSNNTSIVDQQSKNESLMLQQKKFLEDANMKLGKEMLLLEGKMRIVGDVHFGTMILKNIGMHGNVYSLCKEK